MSAIIRAAFDYRRQVREQFQDLLEARYAAAVNDCNTVLLNARGCEARIDPFSLFYGPGVRVDAYASPELREWFATHGRQTFAQFEQQYLEPEPANEQPDETPWSAAS
ncbi:hypothetical protein [Cellulosimicrobium cellulans]|uniref:hypothetical protein n=1 Tax=Cellulosimicrobium cellulans TaxID=1710 RepID=UPI00380E396B